MRRMQRQEPEDDHQSRERRLRAIAASLLDQDEGHQKGNNNNNNADDNSLLCASGCSRGGGVSSGLSAQASQLSREINQVLHIDLMDDDDNELNGYQEVGTKPKKTTSTKHDSVSGLVMDFEPRTDGRDDIRHTKKAESKIGDEREGSLVKQSLKYVARAVECCRGSEFSHAIRFYSLAISLHDTDPKYFCNRSYCNWKISNYSASLEDAFEAIRLDTKRPKSHFIKGQAMFGLEMFEEAEKAYQMAQQLNPSEPIYAEAQLEVRKKVLRELGCDEFDASLYAENNDSIQTAVDNYLNKTSGDTFESPPEMKALASIKIRESVEKADPNSGWQEQRSRRERREPISTAPRSQSVRLRHMSDEESGTSTNSIQTSYGSGPRIATSNTWARSDWKENPRPENIFGFTAVWAGNLRFDITVDKVKRVFEKYGNVMRVTVHPDQSRAQACAYITFDDPEAPSDAIHDLFQEHVWEISKKQRKLKLRFAGGRGQDLHWMKTTTRRATDECISWRTTGCEDMMHCKKVHHLICKGIDFLLEMKRRT